MNCLTKLFQQKRRRIGYILAFSGPMISKRDSSVVDMKDELNKFTITDPTSSKSFSDMEQFVNEHINYAEVQTMLVELERRGFNVDNVKKEG